MLKSNTFPGQVIAAVRAVLTALVLLVSAGAAMAANGFITTNETKLDAIFSQTGFGG